MDKLYIVQKFLTFPAAYIKKVTEFLLCRLLIIKPPKQDDADVEQAYNSLGHAVHSGFKTTGEAALFIFFSPVINLVAGAVLYLCSFIPLVILDIKYIDPSTQSRAVMFIGYIGLMYFGIALLSNVFPSERDARFMWDRLVSQNKTAGKYFCVVPCALLYFGSILEKNSITLIILAVLPPVFKLFLG